MRSRRVIQLNLNKHLWFKNQLVEGQMLLTAVTTTTAMIRSDWDPLTQDPFRVCHPMMFGHPVGAGSSHRNNSSIGRH